MKAKTASTRDDIVLPKMSTALLQVRGRANSMGQLVTTDVDFLLDTVFSSDISIIGRVVLSLLFFCYGAAHSSAIEIAPDIIRCHLCLRFRTDLRAHCPSLLDPKSCIEHTQVTQ
jgi:hypothetical protein